MLNDKDNIYNHIGIPQPTQFDQDDISSEGFDKYDTIVESIKLSIYLKQIKKLLIKKNIIQENTPLSDWIMFLDANTAQQNYLIVDSINDRNLINKPASGLLVFCKSEQELFIRVGYQWLSLPIKMGSYLSVFNGTLSIDIPKIIQDFNINTGGGGSIVQVQADYNETNSSSPAFIKNKPTIPTKVSQLQNDSEFITKEVNTLVNYYTKNEVTDLLSDLVKNTELNNKVLQIINNNTQNINNYKIYERYDQFPTNPNKGTLAYAQDTKKVYIYKDSWEEWKTGGNSEYHVVNNIAERDQLTTTEGLLCYVKDGGGNSPKLFLYTGGTWIEQPIKFDGNTLAISNGELKVIGGGGGGGGTTDTVVTVTTDYIDSLFN